jgi:hypothetical protein
MQVKTGDRIYQEAQGQAEPADSVVTPDYYTQPPQIRLTGNSTGHRMEPEATAEVMLDGNDVATLVECAIRHPAVNMRYAVLAAIWNHPDSFRRIFQFGLEAPLALSEIRESRQRAWQALGYVSISVFGRGQSVRQDAAASDAPAGTSARSQKALVAARCCGRMSTAWSGAKPNWSTAPVTGASSQAILRL